MTEALFWLYLINAVLLINHEIDSAYWKEWDLFKLPGGLAGFLLLHFPLLFIILYGLAVVAWQRREEFDQPVSKFILWATLVVSLCQLAVAVILLAGGDSS